MPLLLFAACLPSELQHASGWSRSSGQQSCCTWSMRSCSCCHFSCRLRSSSGSHEKCSPRFTRFKTVGATWPYRVHNHTYSGPHTCTHTHTPYESGRNEGTDRVGLKLLPSQECPYSTKGKKSCKGKKNDSLDRSCYLLFWSASLIFYSTGSGSPLSCWFIE